jgi:hypothetical protein
VRRRDLEHLLRAAADIAEDDQILVIGSQAILGQFPDAPGSGCSGSVCAPTSRSCAQTEIRHALGARWRTMLPTRRGGRVARARRAPRASRGRGGRGRAR